jgi:hypothetical protein
MICSGLNTGSLLQASSHFVQETYMKKLAIALIAIGGLLSGCVAYEVPNREGGIQHADRDRDGGPDRVDRDRDRDGVPNRQDRRPDDPRRY